MAVAMDQMLATIGRRVREKRNEKGWTAKELAARSGVSQRFLADVEAGRANISLRKLGAIASALGVELTHVLVEEVVSPERALIDELLAGRPGEELAIAHRVLRETLGPKQGSLVALLGLRGAGKSTVGPLLATRLGRSFVELDEHIEQAAGLALSEIFAVHGEAYYRRLETTCFGDLLASHPGTVVALSGGVVLNREAFGLVQRHCTSVWLKATPGDHMQRVLDQGDSRPMADRNNAMAELRALLDAREPLYRQSHVTVDTSRMSVPGVVDSLAFQLRSMG